MRLSSIVSVRHDFGRYPVYEFKYCIGNEAGDDKGTEACDDTGYYSG